MKLIASTAALAALLLTPAGQALAQPKGAVLSAPSVHPGANDYEYVRDAITVATPGLNDPTPTANCVVWVNADSFGFGKAQLDGYHGITMILNLKPLASEGDVNPTSFDQGVALAKAKYPQTPAWIMKTLTDHKAQIEKACTENHAIPLKVHTFTARDRG